MISWKKIFIATGALVFIVLTASLYFYEPEATLEMGYQLTVDLNDSNKLQDVMDNGVVLSADRK